MEDQSQPSKPVAEESSPPTPLGPPEVVPSGERSQGDSEKASSSAEGVGQDEEGDLNQEPLQEKDGKEEAGGKGGGTAIIVPFRDLYPEQQRDAHLKEFVRRMPEVLKGHPFKLFIIEQSNDGRKFNRGKLLNIGFDLACKEGFQTFVFHDVDLIPSVELVPCYTEVPKKPVHIARVWSRYSGNLKYIGGAVAFSGEDFRRINGFPNTFWGWGGEDDEMYKRITEVGLSVSSPPDGGTMEDLEKQSLEQKLQVLRQNREWKCNVKWEVLDEHAKTWKTNGLADLSYDVIKTAELGEGGHAVKHTVDVKLNGHWTDTVFHIEQQKKQDHQHDRKGGGGGRRYDGNRDNRDYRHKRQRTDGDERRR